MSTRKRMNEKKRENIKMKDRNRQGEWQGERDR